MAERILMNEYKQLSQVPWTNIELIDENIFEWSIALIVLNQDSLYYGGYFKAKMTFPSNYPYSPPDFKFLRPLYHPNIYPDGRLCISILHPPGDDEMSGELASERWSPAQRVESVLISILSLLDDPEPASPANVDAGVAYRTRRPEYDAQVRRDCETAKQDIPAGFEMPTHEAAFKHAHPNRDADLEMDWGESGDEDDFGGSDSDFDDEDMEFGDEDLEEENDSESGLEDADGIDDD